MGYGSCCFLCSQALASVLIPAGPGKSQQQELPQIFEVFCDYMNLDLDSIGDECRRKLFPFCVSCTIQVYKLFDFHKEKIRILELLSQMVVSMTTLILENQTEYLLEGEANPAIRSLGNQILSLRNSVTDRYSPKVRVLKSLELPVQSIAPPEIEYAPTADVENLTAAGSTRPMRSSKKEFSSWVRGLEEENESDEDAAAVEVEDDPLDVDYMAEDIEVAADDFEGAETEVSDEDERPSRTSNPCKSCTADDEDEGRNDFDTAETEESDDEEEYSEQALTCIKQLTKKLKPCSCKYCPKSLEERKRRFRVLPVQIDETTFSLENYIYKAVGDKFVCQTCSIATTKRKERIHYHILLMHINYLPHVPDKPLRSFKVDKNKYLLANKFFFTKEADSTFKCFTCQHKAPLWSAMYLHIRRKHFQTERSEKKSRVRDAPRPGERVTKLSDTEFVYLGVNFSTEGDSLKCSLCKRLRKDETSMRGHIRMCHLDRMPRVPNVTLEEIEITPNVFCLTRKYVFEKTGAQEFQCSTADCGQVTSTWTEMYTHIRTAHWKMEGSRWKKLANDRKGYARIRCALLAQGLIPKRKKKEKPPPKRRRIVKKSEPYTVVEVRPNEFLYNGKFTAHMLDDGKMMCGVDSCRVIRNKGGAMVQHMRSTHAGGSTVCETCGKVVKEHYLTRHIATVHGDDQEKQQDCPTCQKQFHTKASLDRHIQRVHRKKKREDDGSKNFQCHVCPNTYKFKGSLEEHIHLQHSETKPTFPCDKCDKVYNTGASLSIHEKYDHVNAGQRIHQCPICQKEFKYKETIRRHVLVVHEGKKSTEVYKRNKKPPGSGGSPRKRRRSKKGKAFEVEDSKSESEEEMDYAADEIQGGEGETERRDDDASGQVIMEIPDPMRMPGEVTTVDANSLQLTLREDPPDSFQFQYLITQ